MQITDDLIDYLANLAKIKISDQKRPYFAKNLAAILDYVEALQKVETAGVAATYQVTGQKDIHRPDVAVPANFQAGFFKNVPREEDGLVKVKKVM